MAEVDLNFLEPDMFTGTVQECTNEVIVFNVEARNGVTKATGRECEITVYTQDGTATGQSVMDCENH